MNGNKRYVAQKGNSSRNSGKSKEIPTSSRNEPLNIDTDAFINNLPIIRQSENSKQLPKYSSILARNPEDGVNMDDLDQLQLDLEKLISTCALRERYIRSETECIDRSEDRKGKSYDKSSLKRKRADDRTKYKEFRNGTRPLKKSYALPVNSQLIGDVPGGRHEMPRINLPKNETSDKFWASVEPYCAPIGPSHASFLDKLIEECSQEVDIKIPELGDYYALEWNDSTTNVEQSLGLGTKNSGMDLKKNGLNAMVESFSNPKTQRLLAALIEERVMTSFPSVTGKLKPSDLNIIKSGSGPRPALCMDRRLKKDLVEQGILTIDDLPKTMPDDEILQEITKCQQELATVNEYNVQELKRLQVIVENDIKRQELKAQLNKVDNQVMELYNKVLLTKQKHIQLNKDEDMDKAAFTKILKEYEVQTDLLLKQQFKLQKELADLPV